MVVDRCLWKGLIVALIVGASSVQSVAASPDPHIYRLGPGDVPGWTVNDIRAGRVESNWQAWRDSRPQFRYFYRGAWRQLGRQAGWFESFGVGQGIAQAHVVVLVSQFGAARDAQRAYEAIVPRATGLTGPGPVSLRIGDAASEWQTNVGVASGLHGLAGYFGGYTTYMQAGATVAEIRADVGGAPGAVLKPPLPNPGHAIARHLAQIARRG